MEKTEKKKKISLPVLIINIIVTAIFVFVFICLCTVMIQTVTGKEPTLFGYRSFVVLTESMTGTYDKGDVIIVKVLDGEELESDPSVLKEGDVVTFIAPQGFGAVEGYTVTHRVVEAPFEGEDGKYYIRTKGDAAEIPDAVPIPVGNVTGIVLGKSELLAGLQNVLKSKTGFLLIIVVPLVAIALWQIGIFAVASSKSRKQKTESGNVQSGEGLSRSEIEDIKEKAIEEYLKNKDGGENEKN